MRANWLIVAILLSVHFFAYKPKNQKTETALKRAKHYLRLYFRPLNFIRKGNIALYIKSSFILLAAAGLFL